MPYDNGAEASYYMNNMNSQDWEPVEDINSFGFVKWLNENFIKGLKTKLVLEQKLKQELDNQLKVYITYWATKLKTTEQKIKSEIKKITPVTLDTVNNILKQIIADKEIEKLQEYLAVKEEKIFYNLNKRYELYKFIVLSILRESAPPVETPTETPAATAPPVETPAETPAATAPPAETPAATAPPVETPAPTVAKGGKRKSKKCKKAKKTRKSRRKRNNKSV